MLSSHLVRHRLGVSRPVRKVAGIALTLAVLLALSGCWVTSINSLYEDGNDRDVVVEKELAGAWSLTDDEQCVTTLTITIKNRGYEIESAQQGERCGDAGKTSHQEGVLVKLDEHEFLDVAPRAEDVCDSCIAKHQIYLTRIGEDSLELVPIDSDWLKAAVEAKTVTLSTLADDTDTLTASSKDLKDFCRRFAGDQAAFKNDDAEVFERGSVPAAEASGAQ
jgi:hypothetical protein